MSVINKMLQELDQRQAGATPGGSAVRPMRVGAGAASKGREAFWRLLALLMLACVVWVAVLAYQLQAQPVVTALAFKAAEDALLRPISPLSAIPAAVATAVAIAPQSAPIPRVSQEMLKLAPSIQTRIPTERTHTPVVIAVTAVTTAPPIAAAAGAPAKSNAALDAARSLQPSKPLAGSADSPGRSGKVEKRDRPRTALEQAEADYRRAAGLLNDGRVGDAKDAMAAALSADRSHEAARQALAALLLDERQIEPARALLQDGLAINPGNAVFASSLARILIETREYDAALKVLQGASAAGVMSAEYQALAGAAHQRLGNQREAMDAYQAALRLSPASGSSWTGLGISLEALGHRPEAAEAFRRAIATESLSAELRKFAEIRLRQAQ